MDAQRFPRLSALQDPLNVHSYSLTQLQGLADEARQFLIESIQKTGGHLGAALGVVELTVALFHEFDFLQDRIAWDVGHQAHVHKLLTGRGPQFAEYGTWEGLCKFLERRESPYDHIGAGHASTSISSALGMAVARDLRREQHHVLAVIGDGAMTGGLAYEALSMAGDQERNLIVVFNDNGMSIDRNVGRLSRTFSRTLTRITASDSYNALRDEVKKVSGHVPFGSEILKGLKHMERSVKDYASPDQAAFFESLGFRYFGPVDGHDLRALVSLLHHAKTMQGPILLHVSTIKGKGLGPAVENTFEAHAVSPPKSAKGAGAPMTSWTRVYTEGMTQIMAEDERVVALTAAMLSNTGLAPLQAKFPHRVLDVGIAEANAYCSAAGMAVGGLRPFVTVYSTFSQRAFDQMIHDIALQSLPVRIMMDRGGFVGTDGPTHHGIFDHSYLRLIPGMVHMAPSNELEMRRMMLTAWQHDTGPIAMRFARGDTPAMDIPDELAPIPVGQGEALRNPRSPTLTLLAVGTMVPSALETAETLEAEGIKCSVVNARFIKPLDEALLLRHIARAKGVLTLEENVTAGGFGEAVLALMARKGVERPVRVLGAPDAFVSFGSQKDQLGASGLTVPQLIETARAFCREVAPGTADRGKRTA